VNISDQKSTHSQAIQIALQHFHAERYLEAETICRQILAADPEYIDALHLLGIIACHFGRAEKSIELISKAIQRFPANPSAHNSLGEAYRVLNRLDEAETCYRKAIALRPDFAEAYNNLGCTLKERDSLAEAEACYKKAIALRPDFAEARWELAMAQIPAICGPSDNLEIWRDKFARELAELDVWFDKKRIEHGHQCVGLRTPFHLAYQEENNRDLLKRYGMLCARLMEAWKVRNAFPVPKTIASDRVKVGVVSAHVCDHSVWNAIAKSWYSHFDRKRFELLTFYIGSKYDAETTFAKSESTYFEQGLKNLSQWVRIILAKQPDVLVYPEIGMDAMTMKLASLRLAPVQVVAWGHPETSGLPTMDYFLSAEDFEPPGGQENYSEQLVALPHLGCCYPQSSVTVVDPDFNSLKIDSDVPMLICPGTPFKYSPQHDRVLVEIARKVERCQFIFFINSNIVRDLTEKLRRRIEEVFAQSGLDFNKYCVFIPWQSRSTFYGLMKRAQVYLDTIGFSGFNTAMQAVECGLPIVTKEGRFMRGRLASGILRRMGLSELIAHPEEEYIALAIRLALDGDYRQQIRERIKEYRHTLYGDLAPIRAFEQFLLGTLKRTS